jgi:hypothetical protein
MFTFPSFFAVDQSRSSAGVITDSPLNYSGLVAWWDADDAATKYYNSTTLATPGQNVRKWVDKIGGKLLENAGGAAPGPVWIGNARNGRAALGFSPSQYLSRAGAHGFPSGSASRTVIVVAQKTDDVTRVYFSFGSSASNAMFACGQGAGCVAMQRVSNDLVAAVANGFHCVVAVETHGASPPAKVWADDVAGGTGTASNTNANYITCPGIYGVAAPNFMQNGCICEILVFNRALADSEIHSLYSGFSKPKWNLP